MPRFRFRTVALVGPWRDSRRRAEADAVAANQAIYEGSGKQGVRWRVPGTIEESDKD